MLPAGKLDRRIELQSLALDQNGDPTSGQWNTEVTVWAEQMDKSQVERIVSSQELAEATRIYRIRYYENIDPTWRVKHGEDYWRILGTPEGDDGRKVSTLLLCERYDPSDREFD